MLVTGCGEEEKIVEEIRSLKTITVGEATAGQPRRFSGVVRAVDRSALSFEISGNVLVVNVDIGASVSEGQVLAELDKEPFELEVEKAEAGLVTAEAKVNKEKAEYERQKKLLEQGAGAQRRVEQAEFAYQEALSSVDAARSTLSLAKRDLNKTVLYAPFKGSIGVREVEPFVEVRRGQRVFEIDAEGEQEIVVDIPETIVHLLNVDMPVDITFPTLPGETTEGKVTEIGSLAGEGSAFPVKVRLLDAPPQVRSGMTAETMFELKGGDFSEGYLIPGHAVRPTTDPNVGFAFVYQPDTSTVKKVPIQWLGVKDNMVIVTEGLSPGDVLAVAGVSFLSDGMKVKLMEPKAEKVLPDTFEIKQ